MGNGNYLYLHDIRKIAIAGTVRSEEQVKSKMGCQVKYTGILNQPFDKLTVSETINKSSHQSSSQLIDPSTRQSVN